MGKRRAAPALGWIAVAVTVAFTGIWSYWGIVENFHEGWYSPSLADNLAMLFFQYLSVPLVFMALGLFSLRFPKIGLGVHVVLAAGAAWFFRGASFQVLELMIVLPILGLGLLYAFGRPQPRKWAYRLILAVPVLIILCVAPFKLAQVSQRVDDGDFGARLVQGNGVALVWAPRGPGWPDKGVPYDEAEAICRRLSADGTTLMETDQNVWRLPTAEEAVRSMALHGQNAGGAWDEAAKKASYRITPDKETPLWDPHSQIIYYWAGGDTGKDDTAYIVVYDGGVFTRQKISRYGYLSFRAVKDP
jgi:hypothetical protein